MDRELEELAEKRNTTVEPMEGGAKVEHGWTSWAEPGGRPTEVELDEMETPEKT